ncbi:MAG TPA: NUDIX hydrolase [Actinophytocola sp.]|jgi:8-oxo-dGTP diphosphatase|nr:NUDIX hydrolase [Actinophytocola sp.]
MAAEIAAAGAVVWRLDEHGSVEIALVHRPRYDDWSLPKGKLDPGENHRTAAVREVAEETGFHVALGRHLGRTGYHVTRPRPAPKVVEYYAAKALRGSFVPGDEVDELRWVSPAAALRVLSYQHDEPIVRTFLALPPDLTTLLLVRHAKAGSRSAWDGPDSERPLSANGLRQLPHVTSLSALYGVTRVHSAPLVRCVDTVGQVASSLGVAVAPEPLLSEEGYARDSSATVERLLSIAASGGTPVVCSQGRVIPDLVSRVAKGAGVPLDEVASKKASVWALFFAPGDPLRLVAADYAPPD